MSGRSEAGNWKDVRDSVAEEWGRLTDATFDHTERDDKRPLGVLHGWYGRAEADGSHEVGEFFAGLQDRIARGLDEHRGR